jgi:hypothetical protein
MSTDLLGKERQSPPWLKFEPWRQRHVAEQAQRLLLDLLLTPQISLPCSQLFVHVSTAEGSKPTSKQLHTLRKQAGLDARQAS